MDGIRYWVETEGNGHWFFVAFPVCLLVLFIWFKGRRVRFLIPSLLISIVIINPLFYRYWDEFGLYAYWRILWIVPVIPVLAAVVPCMSGKINRPWLKGLIALTGVGIIALGGTFLYNGAGGVFVEAENTTKLPNDVIAVAERLLEMDEHPREIADPAISVYIRQYTANVEQLFGRNIYPGYIVSPDSTAIDTYWNMTNGEYEAVSQTMLDEGYDYLVLHDNAQEVQDKSLHIVDRVGDYGIYGAIGFPSIIKKRNELGQVISATTIDNNGFPINQAIGYATIEYEYDDYGYVCREAYFNRDGSPCNQIAGHTAIEQRYDEKGRILSRSYLGDNNQLITRCDGYSNAEWKIGRNGITREVHVFNKDTELEIEGINLAKDVITNADGWSEWITPENNSNNVLITIGEFYLPERAEGDTYSCHIEIEFSGLSAIEDSDFRFWALSSVDGAWDKGSIWDNSFVYVDRPIDGIWSFSSTKEINSEMIEGSCFSISFRCDNWASGSFRFRNVKIEKGDAVTEWTPGM